MSDLESLAEAVVASWESQEDISLRSGFRETFVRLIYHALHAAVEAETKALKERISELKYEVSSLNAMLAKLLPR